MGNSHVHRGNIHHGYHENFRGHGAPWCVSTLFGLNFSANMSAEMSACVHVYP